MSALERRQFLKIAALSAASSAAASRANAAPATTPAAANTLAGLDWQKAPCRFCGTGCHVKVGIRDGKVAAIAGHESAEVNKGLLCVKGYHVGGILYGKDRLTTPQLRDENGELQPISWEEAIDIIAKRIMADPAKFAFYGSGQWTIPEGFAAQTFMKAGLASNQIEPNARLCMASAVTGYVSTYGVDEPAGCYDDLDVCNTLICWGNNPAEMHPVLFSRVMDRRSRGEKVELIDIGTRRTRTTEFADQHINFRPQTDLAIANCIAHYLVYQEKYNKRFVEKFCNFRADEEGKLDLMGVGIDFAQYKKYLAPYTIEYTSKLSGIPAEQLQHLCNLFADPKIKITSLWCMGMNQHTRGTAINRLVHGIHLLSGKFGTPGNAPTSLTGQPSACGTAREVGTLCHALPGGLLVANPEHRDHCEKLWNIPAGRINPTPGYHTVEMWKRFCTPTAEGGDITTILVQVTNPGQTMPNLKRNFQNKKNLKDKFLIVSDVYPTATTALADLVLPAALWVEKGGVVGNSERRTQQWFKMVNPPGDARPDAWMTIAIAHRLLELGHPGMKDKDGNFILTVKDAQGNEVPAWDFNHYYDVNVDEVLYERYRPFTHKKHKNVAPYQELVKHTGMRWPVTQHTDGVWRETKFRFSEFSDPFVEKGKEIQFYHSTSNDDRAQIWFCPYEPHPEEPDTNYPFWLCTGRVIEHWHSGTMTMRVPQLGNAMPKTYCELHPDDAAELGISNGDPIKVITRRGEIILQAWVNGRGQPPRGSLFVPFFDENRLINEITLDAYCPISKEPDYKKCAAKIARV